LPTTIGKHRPASLPRGDYVAVCSYCGQAWYRSQLIREESGRFACPDEGDGLDEVALAAEQIAWADQWTRRSDHDAPGDPALSTADRPNMDTLLGIKSGSKP
jgi:hypothetical protein